MPILIKKSNGLTKQVASQADKLPPAVATITDTMSQAEAWDVVRNKTLDLFCKHLETKAPADITNRAEVVVAYHLGLGSPEARERLELHNICTSEWPRLLPWFAQPFGTGESVIPEHATWEVHKVAEDDGQVRGFATLCIGEEQFQAIAVTPWAAFAICLMRARAAGLLLKSTPPNPADKPADAA